MNFLKYTSTTNTRVKVAQRKGWALGPDPFLGTHNSKYTYTYQNILIKFV